MRARLTLPLALLVLSACSSSSKETREDTTMPAKEEPKQGLNQPSLEDQALQGDHLTNGPALHGMEGRPESGFAQEAAANLKKGEEALADNNYDEASKYFEYVRTHYPFQEASKVAELKLADTDFEKGEWEAARDRYQNFVKAHPTNPRADYASYQAAVTYYKDAPSDFFLLPPQYEKDLTPVEDALRSMKTFVHDWPNSKYLPDAKKVIEGCESLLAKHDMYVSDFYAKRDHYAGAANRLELLVKNYAESDMVDDALFKLHDLYEKMKQPDKAKDALRRIVSRNPGSSAAKKAQEMLGS